jgi:hypothetical protein
MITDLEYILDKRTGEFNKGIHVSPDWISAGQRDNDWNLYTVEGARKRLNQIKRMKGRKRLSISLGFGEHLSSWTQVTWSVLFDMIRHRDSRFANCTFNQLFYIRLHDSGSVSVWPAYVRNENENRDNDWGKAESLDMPDLFAEVV